MKKIVFVEKTQGSYDPVLDFFNKKNPPAARTAISTSKNTSSSLKPPIDKKITTTQKIQPEKPSLAKREETPKGMLK
jgi:hypothetical protein